MVNMMSYKLQLPFSSNKFTDKQAHFMNNTEIMIKTNGWWNAYTACLHMNQADSFDGVFDKTPMCSWLSKPTEV